MKRHNDIRDFLCSQCPMKFVSARNLERHLTTHSSARPFVCPNTGCGIAFKARDLLTRHLKRTCWKTEGRRNRRTWLNEDRINSQNSSRTQNTTNESRENVTEDSRQVFNAVQQQFVPGQWGVMGQF